MAQKLPNAPLAEVVFELRWALHGPSGTPLQLQSDPGYFVLIEKFRHAVENDGFKFRRERSDAPQGLVLGHSVTTQFLKAEDKPFPLLQLGHGIFASNQATEYEWSKFKRQTLRGVERLLDSYPDMSEHPLRPVHLELRYVDSFDPDLLGHSNVLKFLNEDTQISMNVPKQVIGPKCGELKNGNFVFEFPVVARDDTLLSIQIANGQIRGASSILIISKVISRSGHLKLGRSGKLSAAAIDRWLEDAHDITSPFFQSLVHRRLMTKFKRGSKKLSSSFKPKMKKAVKNV